MGAYGRDSERLLHSDWVKYSMAFAVVSELEILDHA